MVVSFQTGTPGGREERGSRLDLDESTLYLDFSFVVVNPAEQYRIHVEPSLCCSDLSIDGQRSSA